MTRARDLANRYNLDVNYLFSDLFRDLATIIDHHTEQLAALTDAKPITPATTPDDAAELVRLRREVKAWRWACRALRGDCGNCMYEDPRLLAAGEPCGECGPDDGHWTPKLPDNE